jgi:hypothetical protein
MEEYRAPGAPSSAHARNQQWREHWWHEIERRGEGRCCRCKRTQPASEFRRYGIGRCLRCLRDLHLRRRFKVLEADGVRPMTVEDFEQMLGAQGGCCEPPRVWWGV